MQRFQSLGVNNLEKKLSYTYFPGCSVKGMHKSYDVSTKIVSQTLGIELKELVDWNCCGATAYMSVDELKSFILSTRNLALAEKEGMDIVTICAACYNVLNKSNHYFNSDPSLRKSLIEGLAAANLTYYGKVKVRHILDVILNDVGEEAVRSKVVKPLKGLKVAPYYGCLINRPKEMFDDPETPESMHHILGWAGADVIDFPAKTKCCGSTITIANEEVGSKLLRDIIFNAKDNGAEVLAVACPFCQLNLDVYQQKMWKRYGSDIKLPAVYFTQILGLSFGLSPKQLDLGKEIVPIEEVLAKISR